MVDQSSPMATSEQQAVSVAQWFAWPSRKTWEEVRVELRSRDGTVWQEIASDFQYWMNSAAGDMCDDVVAFRIVDETPLPLPCKSGEGAEAIARSASLALMYLQTGFLECPGCGAEVPTKDLDAAVELAEVVKPASGTDAFADHLADAGKPIDHVPDAGKLVRELGSPCENCGKPVEAGQLILYYDDVGEMHADCENPFSLEYDPPKDAAPDPMILLGSPMVHVPLALIAPDRLAGAGKPIAAVAEPFLDQLRRVNLARYEAWVEGADAGIMFDALELGGEVGELLNVVKKLEREERGWRGSRASPEDFADECADVMICLDKLARRRNVDLAAVTISKFNATSEKVGLPHRLEADFGNRAPAEQEIAVSVAERVEPRPVGDPKIIQVEDRPGSQREAEGVPRDHACEDTSDSQTREAVLAHAVANILPIGDDRAPGDRVIPIYVRMDELRALSDLAALSTGVAK